MNILVTGGTGFIGSHITKALIEAGHKVYVTGNHSENALEGIAGFFELNLIGLNWDAIRSKNIEAVYHLAANNDTQSSDSVAMHYANMTSAFTFFNNMRSLSRCHKFVYASSAAVYGHLTSQNSHDCFVEGQAERPLTHYGNSKLQFDRWACEFQSTWGVNVIGLRYSNVYGNGEKHKGKRASMISQILHTMLDDKQPEIFEFGEQARDWIYIKDVVKANLLALESDVSGIFNCASGIATPFNKIVEIINTLTNSNLEPKYIKNPYDAGYQTYTLCNINKIRQKLNFEPDYTVQAGISEMLSEIFNKKDSV